MIDAIDPSSLQWKRSYVPDELLKSLALAGSGVRTRNSHKEFNVGNLKRRSS